MRFKVGNIYKDRGGRSYTFITHIPEAVAEAQLVFLSVKDQKVHTRYVDGMVGSPSEYDILPPEKGIVRLYPALYKNISNGGFRLSAFLYETCPEEAVRLVTEYPPVLISEE